ncbi:MAG: hypothetical protein JNL42_04010, partial [Anaerolineae bacterium]|nr:hypothetical protein [Anaerolineae bacterium]
MRDKRPVDELSIDELERILAIRKREERQKQLERMRRAGRLIDSAQETPPEAPSAPPVEPEYDPVASALSAMTRIEPLPA